MEPSYHLNNCYSDVISVDVPEIILQMFKLNNQTTVKDEWEEASDENNLCEPADKTVDQSNDHEVRMTRNIDALPSSRDKCNVKEYSKINNPVLIERNTESPFIYKKNMQNKTFPKLQRTNAVEFPSTSQNIIRSKLYKPHETDFDPSSVESNEESYTFTIDDVQKALEAMRTRKDLVKNAAIKLKAPPLSNDKPNLNKEMNLDNLSIRSDQCKTATMRAYDAGSSHLHAKDSQNKTQHQMIGSLERSSTSDNNPIPPLLSLNQSIKSTRENEAALNNPTSDVENETHCQYELNNMFRSEKTESEGNVFYKIENELPVIENVFQFKEEHKDNEDITGKKIISSKGTKKAKHIYNVKTILECTNATLIRACVDVTCMCYFCDELYPNPIPLKEHALNSHTTIINAQFTNVRAVKFVPKLDVTGLHCKLCDDPLDNLENTIRHLNEVHNKNLFMDIKNQILPFKFIKGLLLCCVCAMSFINFRSLWRHSQSHYRNFECDKCYSGFVSLAKLRSHDKLVHKNSRYSCKFCSTEFATKSNMTRHVQNMHAVSDTYKCSFCDKTFDDMNAKELHLLRVHSGHENVNDDTSKMSVDTINNGMDTSKNNEACDVGSRTWNDGAVDVKQSSSLKTRSSDSLFSSSIKMNFPSYKYCIVPQCESTTIRTPNKLFFNVPNTKQIRLKWLKLAKRNDIRSLSMNSKMYFCEDHFDLPNDMENYMEYQIMGMLSKVLKKPGCTPSKFHCQEDRRKRTCGGPDRPYITKKKRMMAIAECLRETEDYTPSSSFKDKDSSNTSNKELRDDDNDKITISKTNVTTQRKTEKKSGRQDKESDLEATDNRKTQTDCIDLTDDCIDLTNGPDDPTCSTHQRKNICVTPIYKGTGLTSERVDIKNKCHICEKLFNTQYDLIAHKKECLPPGHHFSGKVEDINEVKTEKDILKKVHTIQHHSMEKYVIMGENTDESLSDVVMSECKVQNLHEELQVAEVEQPMSDKNMDSQNYTDMLTKKDKHIYNIQTILQCTNATLVKPREDLACACYFCDVYFNNPADLKNHAMKTHVSVKNIHFINISLVNFVAKLDVTGLYCKLCNDVFDSLENIIIHLNESHNKNLFIDIKQQILPFKFDNNLLKCCICPTSFDNFQTLIVHLQTHYNNFACEKCNLDFVDEQNLRAHQKLIHNTSYFSCEFCLKQFKTRIGKRRHLKEIHEPYEIHKGGIYKKSFKDIFGEEQHLTNDHNGSPENISSEMTDVSVVSIKKDVEPTKMDEEASHNCRVCGSVFLTWDALSMHVKECPVVNNRFSGYLDDLGMAVKREGGDVNDNSCTDDPHETSAHCDINRETILKLEAPSLSKSQFHPGRLDEDEIKRMNDLPHPNVLNKSLSQHQVLPLEHTSKYNALGTKSSMILRKRRDLRMEETHLASSATFDDVRRELHILTQEENVPNDAIRKTTDLRKYDKIPSKGTSRKKHLYNVTVILNCSNATLVRSQDDAGYKCYCCNECFPKPSLLKEHNLQMHTNIEKRHFAYISDCVAKMDVTGLICKVCGRQMESLECLINHLNVFHETKLFTDIKNQILAFRFIDNAPQCCVCSKSFSKFRTLLDHMKSHYINFVCGECGAGFVTRVRLLAHEKNHSLCKFPCHLCDKQFKTKRNRQNHERIVHYHLLNYKCSFCGERLRSMNQRELHIRWVHKGATEEVNMPKDANMDHNSFKEVELSTCQDKHYFNINVILNCTNATLIYSHESFGYTCYFCDKFYTTPWQLKEHALEVHAIIPRMQIYKNYHLRNITKLDITGLRCMLCNRNYDTLENIINHLEGAHNKRIFFDIDNRIMPLRFVNGTPQCCYCKEEFRDCVNLVTHLKDHYRNYVCNMCDLGFINKKQLIHHLRSNEEVHGKFKCNVCSEKFNTSGLLKEHVNAYHDKMYPCLFCNKVYKSRDGERRHRLNVHKEDCGVSANECVKSTTECSDGGNKFVNINESGDSPKTLSMDTKTVTDQHEEITKPLVELVLKYNDDQELENNIEMTENELKNVCVEPQNVNMEISQKCHVCDMVFVTWDALSVHIKECSSFAKRFIDEVDEINENEIEDPMKTAPDSKIGNEIADKEEGNVGEFSSSLIARKKSKAERAIFKKRKTFS